MHELHDISRTDIEIPIPVKYIEADVPDVFHSVVESSVDLARAENEASVCAAYAGGSRPGTGVVEAESYCLSRESIAGAVVFSEGRR